jgi:hypothetical protein
MGDGVRGNGGNAAAGEAAFDVWLRDGLRRLHAAVLDEPIPEDMLRLIEEDGRATAAPDPERRRRHGRGAKPPA